MTRRRTSLPRRIAQTAGTLLLALPALGAALYGVGRLIEAAGRAVGLR